MKGIDFFEKQKGICYILELNDCSISHAKITCIKMAE
jgi:hypothetical protein